MLKASQIKIGLAVVVLVSAIAYLAFTGFEQSMVYYLTVKELKAKGSDVYGQDVRVSGWVREGSIRSDRKDLEHKFVITEEGEDLPVVYNGVTPDTFKDGAEVVVEGRYDSGGVFKAENLLAKCPSKYEAMGPGGNNDNNGAGQ
jgi:cytochrome c-type biogenesis protein CcmE